MALLARCTTAILLVAALIDCGADSRPGPSKQPPDVAGWRTVWADEFDGSAIPDSTKWVYEVGGHGWGNNELQFYTESRRENARIEGGVLIIEARREEWQGRVIHVGAAEFSSGVAVRSDRSASETAAWSRHLAGDLDAASPRHLRERRLARQRGDRHHGTCRFRSQRRARVRAYQGV